MAVAGALQMLRSMKGVRSRTGTPWLSPQLMQAMVTGAPNIRGAQGNQHAPMQGAPAHWMGLGWNSVEEYPSPSGGKRYTYSKDGARPGIQT